MHIREGETVNFVQDVRTVELAVVDPSDPKTDDVVVVPRSLLKSDEPIRDEHLPFEVERSKVPAKRGRCTSAASRATGNLATAGAGLAWIAERASRPARHRRRRQSRLDRRLHQTMTKKDGGQPLGTYLVSVELLPQTSQARRQDV